MTDHEGPIEHNPLLPAPSQAAIFVGKVGSREVVEISPFNYIAAPDGSVGMPANQLGELAAELTPDSIVWIRVNHDGAKPIGSHNGAMAESKREEPIGLLDGRVDINPDRRELIVDGNRLELTRKEFGLLLMLARNAGRAVDRQEIMQECWDSAWSGNTKTIDAHVRNIRKKMGETSWILKTVRGVGFIIDDRIEPEKPPETE